MKLLKWLESGLLSIAAIFMPIKGLLIATGVLIFADLITGILAARKKNIPISSAGLRRTLSKILVYETALCLAFIAEHYISDIMPFIKMCSAMISVVELKSIYENMNTASGQELLKAVIDKIGSDNDPNRGSK